MAEPTNPVEGVEQSVEQRLVAFYAGQGKKAAPKPDTPPPAPEEPEANAEEAPEETADQAAPEEVADDPEVEIEAPEDTPSPVDEFEIVHAGQQHKLTRAQTIELAQKGFDYTQKTQALSAKENQISEALQAAQQVVQMQVALAPEIAQVEGFKSALAEYKDVNWVQLAQQDAGLYAQHRARYDQLRDGLQGAESTLNQKFTVIHEGNKKASETLMQAERDRLPDLIPAFRDPKKRAAEAEAIAKAAMADGYTAEELANIPQARYIRTLWKAKEYDRLMSAQGVKLKQMREAAPMAKPGAANPVNPQAQQVQKDRARLKKTGDFRDAAKLFAKMKI